MKIQRVFEKRSRVRGLVMQWEGISTQCICGTPHEPFEISVFGLKLFVIYKGVFIYNYVCLRGKWVFFIAFVRVSRPFAYISNEGIKTP